MKNSTNKITTIAMFCTLAYISVVVGRIPMISFLKYEPKDVIIAIGSFILGPVSAIVMSVVVSLVEMITISSTGHIGLIMNILATISFVLPAAIIYQKNKNIKSVSIGLVIGTLTMTVVMLSWNYFLYPIFMGFPREKVLSLFIPVFIPFNLIKGGINTAITILLYGPVMNILKKSNLFSSSEMQSKEKDSSNKVGMIVLAVFILLTSILYLMLIKKVI